MAETCRFCGCDGPLIKGVCQDKNCTTYLSESCKKTKKCGHSCCGITGEKVAQCPPCLECSGSDEICAICLDSLKDFPMMVLDCGHSFHYGCMKSHLRTVDNNVISFNNGKCPLCRTWIKHPKFEKNIYIKKTRTLHDKVEVLAAEQTVEMGWTMMSPEVIAHNGDPIEYAMWKLEFFNCTKCKKPYCGGDRMCSEGMENGDKKKMCPNCKPKNDRSMALSSRWSGGFSRFSENDIKPCHYCDNLASYHCWGMSYMCYNCHQHCVKTKNLPEMKK